MLDEGRHFFGKEEVKRVLDIMATYKMNRFHWHLADDQGWRIEIKKYPLLAVTTMADMERDMIARRIEENDGNMTLVAKSLGISRQTLYNKIKRYGL